MKILQLQVVLDRLGFSPGTIDVMAMIAYVA